MSPCDIDWGERVVAVAIESGQENQLEGGI